MAESILDIVNQRVAEYVRESPRKAISKRAGIQMSDEFERIDSLPRRVWSDDDAAILATIMTDALRLPGGKEALRPVQAVALYEIGEHGGLIAPIRVGGGKTHISILAPLLLNSYRPLLILPAKLIPKTERALRDMALHWQLPRRLLIKSYEWLGRTQAARYLESTRPDVIILDEAHRVRNPKAAVTRRFRRYVEKYQPRVIAMSGTLIRKRLLDWAHLADAALGGRSPAPRRYTTIVEWGTALDHNATMGPGVLRRWCDDGEDIREAYRRRVTDTPGVVATSEALLGVGLTIDVWRTELPAAIRDAQSTLDAEWILPDGLAITDPLHYYRAARTLALGVYYRYRVPPPAPWLDARRAWGAFVRHACRHLRDSERQHFDSEKQVALAIVNDRLRDDGSYMTWRGVRDTFRPEIEHVWITYDVIDRLISDAREARSIVWVEAIAVGLTMHERGLTYYGAEGKSPDKRSILDATITEPFAASIQSAGEGQNLQPWSDAIVTAPMPDAARWEQMLGRQHRDGQEADEVTVRVCMLGEAHSISWERAVQHARYLESITGQPQKLLQATMVDPALTEEIENGNF